MALCSSAQRLFDQNSFAPNSIPHPHHGEPRTTTCCHLHEIELSSPSMWGGGGDHALDHQDMLTST